MSDGCTLRIEVALVVVEKLAIIRLVCLIVPESNCMRDKLVSTIHKILQKESEVHHYRGLMAETERILKNIEPERGVLSPRLRKLSKEYARDVLGHKRYAPWLNVYAAVAGEFKEGWIPDNYHGSVVNPYLTASRACVPGVKTLSSKFIQHNNLPDIAYYLNGLFFSTAREVIAPKVVEEKIFDILNRDKRVVFKTDMSLRGLGVHIFTKETFDIKKIPYIGNGVLQYYIKQHPSFMAIMPDSVATLRLTSVVEDSGIVSCRGAFMRFNRTGNTHCMWDTDVKVPIDLETGQFDEKGYMPDWRTISYHPDTNVFFKGNVIPRFKECIAFITKAHQEVSFCRLIGWDLIVDENEKIQLIELNCWHSDIKVSEATQGPCFADMGWEKLWKRHL